MPHRTTSAAQESLHTGFYRLPRPGRTEGNFSDELSSLLSEWQPGNEGVLVLVPHDDDATIGMGMLLRYLVEADIPLHIAIVTDGRFGYTSTTNRATITAIRHVETVNSCRVLGITPEQVTWLGFPDCDLARFKGKRLAAPGEPTSPDGFTGLEDAFVRVLRAGIPHHGTRAPITRVFVPAASDYHNDHVVVAEQLLISLFHAQGTIWPECGAPLTRRPYCYNFAIYCDFAADEPPNLLYRGSEEHFCAKMQSIMEFSSQTQIAALVEGLEQEGPFELFREVEFKLFSRTRQLVPFLNQKFMEP